MGPLRVSKVAEITGRGTVVFFEEDPVPWLPWRRHTVRITKPDGVKFEAIAHVEFARKVPPGEAMALLFPDLKPSQIPPGSEVDVVGAEFEGHGAGA
jgi:hypothetical protein